SETVIQESSNFSNKGPVAKLWSVGVTRVSGPASVRKDIALVLVVSRMRSSAPALALVGVIVPQHWCLWEE
ncbi:unnamed protein product, partial [Staurois parvus]